MKKIFFFLILCFCFINVYAKNLIEVRLDKCVDGDTAWFIYNGKSAKFRFLAINTPESTNKIEPFGKDASNYTCQKLQNASKIEIEFDPNSNEVDKYGRYLAWIFVDGNLLQENLIKKGYAEIKYIYGDYLYLDILKKSENCSRTKKIGIFSEKNNGYIQTNNHIISRLIVITIIILFIFNRKYRKKIIKLIKSTTKRKLKKSIKKIH